mgnify:CR=1 FL=1|tara:strand:- start:55 stop:246 length:192 start_codon:yes stop_codon:yes gene_type:complete
MKYPKGSVNQLLSDHPNLNTAVGILIDKIKNHDGCSFYEWDKFRAEELGTHTCNGKKTVQGEG